MNLRSRFHPRYIGFLLCLVAALCLFAPPAVAQIEVQFGATEGGNFSRFGGSDRVEASAPTEGATTLQRRPGFLIGALVALDPPGAFGLQSEVLWIWKGSKAKAGARTTTTKVNYVEVPVLAKVETPVRWGPITTHVLAGPTVALATQSQRYRSEVDADGRRRFVNQRNLDDATRKLELGIAVGGEIGYDFSDSATMTLGVRYRRGLTRAFDQPTESQTSVPDAWNQGLAVTLGFIYSSGWTFSFD